MSPLEEAVVTATIEAPRTEPVPAELPSESTPQPLIFVIFGATGDLTHRKLLPALYKLAASHMLPANFAVVGVARRDKDPEDFRAEMKEAVSKFADGGIDSGIWDAFAGSLHFCVGQFQDADSYSSLKRELSTLHTAMGTRGNVVYYLATPPEFDSVISENLNHAGLITPSAHDSPWTRVIFEKPFGRDLSSAINLNREIHRHLAEDQIYRIDHYLGKETVQNIMAVRFANGILEPLWTRNYVDNIQITASESIGIENRASYYETAGALRDMVQSHLLQVFSLVAMEPPGSWSAKAIHDEKVKVLQAMDCIEGDAVETQTARGQYGPGWVDGQPVPGYREEPGVAPNSTTETFAALKLHVDSWRWAGVPIYLRTGKRLPRRATEVALTFKSPPQMLFKQSKSTILPDVLSMRIQPDEGVLLTLNSKIPGQGFRIQPVHLDFLYGATFSGAVPEAYERLLLDAMRGDATLFTRTDEVEAGWSVIQGILDRWSETAPEFPNYAAGSWGPYEGNALIATDGRRWRSP
jgi:glucose-6-phosphate 1-dehydrogenase